MDKSVPIKTQNAEDHKDHFPNIFDFVAMIICDSEATWPVLPSVDHQKHDVAYDRLWNNQDEQISHNNTTCMTLIHTSINISIYSFSISGIFFFLTQDITDIY